METKTEHVYIKPEINIEVEILPLDSQKPDVLDTKPVKLECPNDTLEQNDNVTIPIFYDKLQNSTEDTAPLEVQKRKIEFDGKVYENGKINRVQCPECDNTFKNRANLKAHLKFVHSTEEDVVECELCFRTFKSVQHLRSHKNSVHADGNTEVGCQHCDKTFPSRKKLNNHVFYCHPQPEEGAKCDVCQKTFVNKYRLKIHTKQVHPSGSPSSCERCDKQFKSAMLLQRHVKWAHPADGVSYRCQECNRVLPSLEGFRRHRASVHGGGREHCALCPKSFKTRGSLARHVAVTHRASPPTVAARSAKLTKACTDCDKVFATDTALSWHYERLHSPNRLPLECSICEKQYSSQHSLRRHITTVHGGISGAPGGPGGPGGSQGVKCGQCGKSYRSEVHLQRHCRVTHAPASEAVGCEKCGKIFKCAMHLKIHESVVHAKEGECRCPTCGKSFSSRKYLAKHAHTHSPRRLPCDRCPKLFKTPGEVSRHVRRVHLKAGLDPSHPAPEEEPRGPRFDATVKVEPSDDTEVII